MASKIPTRQERDANLDKLQQSVQKWAEKEKTRIENETTFLRAVKQGRGAANAVKQNLLRGELAVIDEINAFLVSSS